MRQKCHIITNMVRALAAQHGQGRAALSLAGAPNNRKKIHQTIFLQTTKLVIVIFLLLSTYAYADIGPKPRMWFKFQYLFQKVSIVDAQLIQCENRECTKGAPLSRLGPQHFRCGADGCESLAYGYTKYQKLQIRFADRHRESNVFSVKNYDAQLMVHVTKDSLFVYEMEPEKKK